MTDQSEQIDHGQVEFDHDHDDSQSISLCTCNIDVPELYMDNNHDQDVSVYGL